MKPWIKGTNEGRLYIDTDHPEWIKYFSEFVTNPKNKIKMAGNKNISSKSADRKAWNDALDAVYELFKRGQITHESLQKLRK